MNIFRIAVIKYKKEKAKRLARRIRCLDELFSRLVEIQVDQERLIDMGEMDSLLPKSRYVDLNKELGRLIAINARRAYGDFADNEMRKRMSLAVIEIEHEIGRDITSKRDVMRLISDL